MIMARMKRMMKVRLRKLRKMMPLPLMPQREMPLWRQEWGNMLFQKSTSRQHPTLSWSICKNLASLNLLSRYPCLTPRSLPSRKLPLRFQAIFAILKPSKELFDSYRKPHPKLSVKKQEMVILGREFAQGRNWKSLQPRGIFSQRLKRTVGPADHCLVPLFYAILWLSDSIEFSPQTFHTFNCTAILVKNKRQSAQVRRFD